MKGTVKISLEDFEMLKDQASALEALRASLTQCVTTQKVADDDDLDWSNTYVNVVDLEKLKAVLNNSVRRNCIIGRYSQNNEFVFLPPKAGEVGNAVPHKEEQL